MRALFSAALQRLSVVLLPKRCAFCGEVIAFDETLCTACASLPRITPPLCLHCGCAEADCSCKKHKKEYKQIVAPYYYRDRVVTAVHRFKESEMPFLSERFGKDIADCVLAQYEGIPFDAVAYVPMRWWDRFKRGYNQAELLAAEVAQRLSLPLVDILVKSAHTKPQKRSSAVERKVNVFGAFDVKDKNFTQGKTILLIDDVKTTGSTLNECAKMLKIYGASAVYCATLAVVHHDKKENSTK